MSPALRSAADVLLGRMRSPENATGEYMTPYLRAANVGDGHLRLDDVKTMNFSPDEQVRFALAPGDVLVTEGSGSRSTVGASASWPGSSTPMMFQNTLVRLRALPHIEPRYLYWWSRHAYVSGLYAEASQGLAIWHLSAERVRALPFEAPDRAEQRRVADFLDDQVGRLERAADAHSRVLLLRNELIDSLTWSCLAPARRDSVDHAPLTAMKWLLKKSFRSTTWSQGHVVTAFRDGQVTARSQRRAEGYTEAASETSQAQEVRIGDLVIHGLDGFAGAIGTSESDGVCSPAYHVCQVLAGDSDFYGRLLRLMAVNGYLSLFGGSARERAVDFRNWNVFSQIPVPVVPRAEQERIGNMIRSVRPLAAKVAQMQGLITERTQALITAAVTGQLDVVTAGAVA